MGIARKKEGKVSQKSGLELSSAAKANDYTYAMEYGVGQYSLGYRLSKEEVYKEERGYFRALAFFYYFSPTKARYFWRSS